MLRPNHPEGWLRPRASRHRALRRGRSRRPVLEVLEDRALLTGSFASPVLYPAGTGPNSVAVGDFNADGRPDLAVANENSASVSVLLGTGDGTFRSQQTFAAGSRPSFVGGRDVHADGRA